MTSYFKISYRSPHNGYFEERIPTTDQERDQLYKLYQRCKQQGSIPKTDPEAQALIQGLLNSPDCPPAFKRDGVNGVYIEFNTVSSVMD
jgi:hypothetical protein